jgi:ABC-type Na+ efflux pump permease subunit
MSDSFKCNCETVDYCALKENTYKSSNAKTGDLMYYRESTGSNKNALLEYDYLNLENTLAEKTLEEAEQDRINEISRRRVLENDEGLQFLYDPVTNSLISFKETRDVYNNIQKLENKMDLIDQQFLDESSVDFTSNRIVRNKLLYPALAVNAEELAEELAEETVEEVEETVEEVEETVEEVVKDTVKPEKNKKNSLGTITLIVFLILLVIALISLLIYKKSVYM